VRIIAVNIIAQRTNCFKPIGRETSQQLSNARYLV